MLSGLLPGHQVSHRSAQIVNRQSPGCRVTNPLGGYCTRQNTIQVNLENRQVSQIWQISCSFSYHCDCDVRPDQKLNFGSTEWFLQDIVYLSMLSILQLGGPDDSKAQLKYKYRQSSWLQWCGAPKVKLKWLGTWLDLFLWQWCQLCKSSGKAAGFDDCFGHHIRQNTGNWCVYLACWSDEKFDKY